MESQTELKEPAPAPANNQMTQVAAAIVIAGILIAGAVLLKDSNPPQQTPQNPSQAVSAPAEVTEADRTLGNPDADVTVIYYEDFQCPFCGAVTGFHGPETQVMQYLTGQDPTWTASIPEIKKLAQSGEVLFVYRDFAFLGQESVRAAEAAHCANDQGKFWEYHDYLYSHQDGENKGAFEIAKLKSFAKTLGLNQTSFDQCLDAHKYEQAVLDSSSEGRDAGVRGTPKGFVMVDGEVIATIDGAESWSTVSAKIESAR